MLVSAAEAVDVAVEVVLDRTEIDESNRAPGFIPEPDGDSEREKPLFIIFFIRFCAFFFLFAFWIILSFSLFLFSTLFL